MKKWEFIREKKEEDDSNIYCEEIRDSLLDDDELSPFEEAFLKGYEEAY